MAAKQTPPAETAPVEPDPTPPTDTAPVEAVTTTPSKDWATVYDDHTGRKIGHPVPPSWLDGRFPHLKQVPSQKAGN